MRLFLDPAARDAISWLYSNAEVLEAHAEASRLVLSALMQEGMYEIFSNKFPAPEAEFPSRGEKERQLSKI